MYKKFFSRFYARASVITIILLTAWLLLGPVSEAGELSHKRSQEFATEFLITIDTGDFEVAWQLMTPLFKSLNESHRWVHRQETLRDAYGLNLSRSLRHLTHRKTYANSPDGNYVIVQFESVFTHKKNAVETVVLYCPDNQECLVRKYVIN